MTTEPVGFSKVSLIRPYFTYKYSICISASILYNVTFTWGNPSALVSCSISTLSGGIIFVKKRFSQMTS